MCCCHANNKKIDSEIDTILAGFVAHCNHYSEKNCTGHETYFFEYVAWFNGYRIYIDILIGENILSIYAANIILLG